MQNHPSKVQNHPSKRDSFFYHDHMEEAFLKNFFVRIVMQSPIYWLNALKPYTHLNRHFILKIENKFMVFTSSTEIKGIPTKFISEKNIAGQPEKQYLFEKIHEFDYATMVATASQKGAAFYLKHYPELNKFIAKMQPFVEKIT